MQPKDVIYIINDTALHMSLVGERLQKELGYTNMVYVPCWAHLLSLEGKIVVD